MPYGSDVNKSLLTKFHRLYLLLKRVGWFCLWQEGVHVVGFSGEGSVLVEFLLLVRQYNFFRLSCNAVSLYLESCIIFTHFELSAGSSWPSCLVKNALKSIVG